MPEPLWVTCRETQTKIQVQAEFSARVLLKVSLLYTDSSSRGLFYERHSIHATSADL